MQEGYHFLYLYKTINYYYRPIINLYNKYNFLLVLKVQQ